MRKNTYRCPIHKKNEIVWKDLGRAGYYCPECDYLWPPIYIENGDSKKILIIGDKGSGKTTYLASILYYLYFNADTKLKLSKLYSIKCELKDEILEKLWKNISSNDKSKRIDFTDKSIALAIHQMFFEGIFPKATDPLTYEEKSESEVNNETYDNSNDKISDRAKAYIDTHKINFFITHKKKTLFFDSIDLPGEWCRNMDDDYTAIDQRLFVADGIIFIIDPYSLPKIGKHALGKGILKGYPTPISMILSNLKANINTITSSKKKQYSFFKKWGNMLGILNNDITWSFIISKADQLVNNNIMQLNSNPNIFKPDEILKRKKYFEDFDLQLARSLREELTMRINSSFYNGIHPNSIIGFDLTSELSDTLDIDYNTIKYSPVTSFVDTGSDDNHYWAAQNLVESFLLFLEDLGFLEIDHEKIVI